MPPKQQRVLDLLLLEEEKVETPWANSPCSLRERDDGLVTWFDSKPGDKAPKFSQTFGWKSKEIIRCSLIKTYFYKKEV